MLSINDEPFVQTQTVLCNQTEFNNNAIIVLTYLFQGWIRDLRTVQPDLNHFVTKSMLSLKPKVVNVLQNHLVRILSSIYVIYIY